LRGLKENVIIGHLIPAGTGMKRYRNLTLVEDDSESLDHTVQSVMEARKRDELEDAIELNEELSEGEV
jgi:DNA-directed RNA polymerase subunit beta'